MVAIEKLDQQPWRPWHLGHRPSVSTRSTRYAQVRWWSLVLDDFQLLDEAEMGPDEEECWLVGPDDREIIFALVPEPKTVKNRMHLCIRPTDRTREEEVDRILALGATLVDDRRDGPDKGWETQR